MKLIKKMLAIMFAFMMVVGMGTKVNAEENENTTATTGTITIDNAVKDQTYSIYKILELESFSGDNYSYKPASEEWKNFLNTEDAKNYVTINENGYATWKNGADVKTFAKLALEYAKTNGINNNERSNAAGNTVTFNNLPLGYYLVDSSVGALCNLTTTNPTSSIEEKNEVPTVDKTVNKDNDWVKDNSVNIGDTVTFKTEIKIETGATNYVLHDEMGKGLELVKSLNELLIHFVAPTGCREPQENEYTVVRNKQENSDGFTITFQDSYIQTLPAGNYLTLTYCAVVTNDAPINTAMNNKTWLTFGDNNTSTNESETNTYTFGIPVFKYTGNNKPLAGAKFTLYTDKLCAADNALKFTLSNQKYRYDANGGSEILESLDKTGRVDIEGIKAGTYYLKEVEAPKGYNKLASPIKVEINDNGTLIVDGKSSDDNNLPISQVNVENKTGKLLPSTGGMGTTMIYMAGAILVIASGIVLVSKKRSKAK